MAKYVDSFSNDDRLDLSGLHCPMKRCGSSNVKVLRYPRAGSWMKAIGLARCLGCGAQFSIREVAPPEPSPRKEAVW